MSLRTIASVVIALAMLLIGFAGGYLYSKFYDTFYLNNYYNPYKDCNRI
jgi:hypothetical protein